MSAGQEGPGLHGYIFLPFNGGVEFDVTLDPAAVIDPDDHQLQVVDIRGSFATVVDRYPSSHPAGGEEVWVRLLDLSAQVERHATLAGSAHGGTVAGDPAVGWAADGTGFTVNPDGEAPVAVSLSAIA